MMRVLRRVAMPVALTTLAFAVVMLVVSTWLWVRAEEVRPDGTKAIADTLFIGRVSMLALEFAAVTGVAAGVSAVLAMVPNKPEDE